MLLSLVRWERNSVQTVANYSPLLNQDTFVTSTEAPWVLMVSSPISGVDTATSNPFSRFFPYSCLFSSHECTDQCSFEYLRMTLYEFLELFLCASLSSLVLCLVHSSHLDLHILPALFPQLRRFSRLCQWPGPYKL